MLKEVLTVSALIAVVLLVRAIFKNRVPKRMLYALWLVVLLKLCLPGTLVSLPVLPAEDAAAPAQSAELPAQTTPVIQQPAQTVTQPQAPAQQPVFPVQETAKPAAARRANRPALLQKHPQKTPRTKRTQANPLPVKSPTSSCSSVAAKIRRAKLMSSLL